MSDVHRRRPRRNPSIYRVHYALARPDHRPPRPWPPAAVGAYGAQVAGHGEKGERYLGLLQCSDGTVMKPIIKEAQQREIQFYKEVNESENPDLVELKKFIPKYYGCTKYTYNGFENEYIVLEDLVKNIAEPCIMDAKIGKRTWDPLAIPEKIKNEQTKYAQCKEEFSFCIPGFQVYKLSTGKLHKYGKDYGKKLHGRLVREAFRTYLNGVDRDLCRSLILQFLSELWKIQKWSSKQTAVKIYSASLLLIYDANKIRECCGITDDLIGKPKCIPIQKTRRNSIHSMHTELKSSSSFSGQISKTGPVFRKVNSVPVTSLALVQEMFAKPPPIHSPWSEALEKLNGLHSFENNYEEKLSKIKMDYKSILHQLSDDEPSNPWGTVKIIDFAHAFFNTEDETGLDENFKDGIDKLVEMFESLLRETDDQM